ncbi:putative 4-hydroxy-4-methyl-2-oxoglutarate aldolase [Echinimonas agarilytica]|uniref:4-hydroxy-4-methyl-2-oxoglutarate aldolase n=1 Tax=Echinimonas agarilytica TaxID=1215918 RepID=A0AA41W452_9GAMM|nr:putative 4-hydroxy-4-methyl-2-oxoglutarate aldolase [Echinimonas agarilytica]MCM2678407.1 putative 4-hydroxy-4-methyl-2-oxoglutarate aldolase [Echinimonas agarilytica]
MLDILPDLFDQHAQQLQWLPIQWCDFGGVPTFYGEVQTVRCFEDNSRVKEVLAMPGRGRVLLVDGGGSLNRALLGDLIAQSAQDCGWAGVVILGAVRDVHALKGMSLGIKALGACPIKTQRKGIGELDCVLHIEGVAVNSGDYVYADRHGIAISSTAFHIDSEGAIKEW